MELFRDIPGFEKLYQISNFGRIKSFKNDKFIYLKPRIVTDNYLAVRLYKNLKGINFKIHRLVAEVFIPKLEDKNQINHKDGDKSNNHVDNLERVTSSENIQHAYNTGLMDVKGSKNPFSKLTEKDLPIIRELITQGRSLSSIGKLYNVSRFTIHDIKSGRTWSHLK